MKKFSTLIFGVLILSTCIAFTGVSIHWLRSINPHPPQDNPLVLVSGFRYSTLEEGALVVS